MNLAHVHDHSRVACKVHTVHQLLAIGTREIAHRFGACSGGRSSPRNYPRHDRGLRFALRAELFEGLGRYPDAGAIPALPQCDRTDMDAKHCSAASRARLLFLPVGLGFHPRGPRAAMRTVSAASEHHCEAGRTGQCCQPGSAEGTLGRVRRRGGPATGAIEGGARAQWPAPLVRVSMRLQPSGMSETNKAVNPLTLYSRKPLFSVR